MRPTFAALSKASRRPLNPKRGNKDYYKGTRQAFLPGGLRTGAPGEYYGSTKARYRLLDEKVRVFIAPPVEDINNSRMKPYVACGTHMTGEMLEAQPFGKIPQGGLTGQHYLDWLAQSQNQVVPST
ncbi:hypothetical protein SCHPADRAFT_993273 [Schizopora paradoxa]|uniref:Uncharacterized protein n=1 Tax=Schizopora paradoxa TaxID=27342 RepID=A0A0H2SNY2_9AGAM|nr:hypothetical protein SCHPADRAFT_993273 [Schizopora paradoxa]